MLNLPKTYSKVLFSCDYFRKTYGILQNNFGFLCWNYLRIHNPYLTVRGPRDQKEQYKICEIPYCLFMKAMFVPTASSTKSRSPKRVLSSMISFSFLIRLLKENLTFPGNRANWQKVVLRPEDRKSLFTQSWFLSVGFRKLF